ncbi:MAG: DUF2079 domain-containing protein [Candidatus Hydrogenedentota bacterium]|nr:MAG: DUF2079 domain-containing protein [Candidatus Hydrogenedentota bacterium]
MGLLKKVSVALLPAFLFSGFYFVFAVRGGMPRYLPKHLLWLFSLLVTAALVTGHPGLRRILSRRSREVLVLLTLSYFAAAFGFGHLANADAHAPELYNFHREFLSATQGRLFIHPSEHRPEFAIHFSPIFFLLYPFFKWVPSPVTLLFLGSVALSAAIPAAFRVLRGWWNEPEAILLSTGAGLMPAILSLHMDFSPVRFAPLAFWLMIEGMERRRWSLWWCGFLIVLVSKETLLLGVVFFSVVAWIRRMPTIWIILPGTVGLTTFLIINQFLIPAFAGTPGQTSTIAAQFGYWGRTAPQVLIGFLKDPVSVGKALFRLNNAAYLLKMFHGGLFLAPLGSPYLFLGLPEALVNMLAGYHPGLIPIDRPGPWTSLLGHYSAVFSTAVWASACHALRFRAEDSETEFTGWQRARWLFLAVLSTMIYPSNAETL